MITVVGGGFVSRVDTRMDIAAFFDKGSEPAQSLAFLQERFGGSQFVQIRVAGRPFGLNALAGGSSALEPPLTRADLSFVIDATTLAGSTGCAVEKTGAAPFSGTPTVTIVRLFEAPRAYDASRRFAGIVSGS